MPSPLDSLLSLGRPVGPNEKTLAFTHRGGPFDRPVEWLDYAEMGLGPDLADDLIELATRTDLRTGEPESEAFWAPLHASRALGQFRVARAVEPLLRYAEPQLEEGDYDLDEDLPEIFRMIGPPAVEPLIKALGNPTRSLSLRGVAIRGLESIAGYSPECRETCIAALTDQLRQYQFQDPRLNASLIAALSEAFAHESLPLIHEVYGARRVQEPEFSWEECLEAFGEDPKDWKRPSPFTDFRKWNRRQDRIWEKQKKRKKE
ncbi:hypothetical protein HQ520_04825 [bacterium]|nr:hypothetical protein [bacterium]